MGFLASNGILNRKGFFGGVTAQPAFSPLNISGLKLWVSADYGVTEDDLFINQIEISGCTPSTSDGTYTREIGGNTAFVYNDNQIYFEDDIWKLYDSNEGITFINESSLAENGWGIEGGTSFGTATNSYFNGVSEILDQSGNANNLSYNYGAPSLSLNTINDKPAFYFFGGSLTGSNITTGKTLYAVLKIHTLEPSGYQNILELSGGGLYSSIINNEWGSYFTGERGSEQVLDTETSYIIGSISNDGTTYKYRSNGSQIKTASNGNGFYTRSALYFGNDSSSSQPANCYVAEALVYDTAISDSDAQQLENYLNDKYAIY